MSLSKELMDFADKEAAEVAKRLRLNPNMCRSRYISELVEEHKKKKERRRAKFSKKA